jgi:hypothetical protein
MLGGKLPICAQSASGMFPFARQQDVVIALGSFEGRDDCRDRATAPFEDICHPAFLS